MKCPVNYSKAIIRLPTINSKQTAQSSAEAINSRHRSLDNGVSTFLLIMMRINSDDRQDAAINRQEAIKAEAILDIRLQA